MAAVQHLNRPSLGEQPYDVLMPQNNVEKWQNVYVSSVTLDNRQPVATIKTGE